MGLPLEIRPALSQVAEAPPLELEAKIPLGEIKGRIDHLAFDSKRLRISWPSSKMTAWALSTLFDVEWFTPFPG